MIFTECVECGETICINENREIIGTWRKIDCQSCNASIVAEITLVGGTTYTQDHFEEEVLPELENIERMDHPSGDITIYGDPNKIGIKQ